MTAKLRTAIQIFAVMWALSCSPSLFAQYLVDCNNVGETADALGAIICQFGDPMSSPHITDYLTITETRICQDNSPFDACADNYLTEPGSYLPTMGPTESVPACSTPVFFATAESSPEYDEPCAEFEDCLAYCGGTELDLHAEDFSELSSSSSSTSTSTTSSGGTDYTGPSADQVHYYVETSYGFFAGLVASVIALAIAIWLFTLVMGWLNKLISGALD